MSFYVCISTWLSYNTSYIYLDSFAELEVKIGGIESYG